jgi:phosphatidylethanolamine/phosphatidyl-N-methylethanolamine N-methyltransferase
MGAQFRISDPTRLFAAGTATLPFQGGIRKEGNVGELDTATITRAYARWAPVYDLVFGAVFEKGRRASIAAAERVGGRVLEVGVGTGISLPDYSRKAQARKRDLKLDNVEALSVMDVGRLGFPDAFFDAVVAQYVITAVPDPDAALDEFARVLKPGGEIILVNHISAERGLRRAFELRFAPVARRLGWRPEFEWARLQAWIDRKPNMRVIERKPMPPLGHFSMMRFGKAK